jgi:hypothetical protein
MRKRKTATIYKCLLVIALTSSPTLCSSKPASARQEPGKNLSIIQYPLRGKCLPLTITSLLMGGPNHDVVTAGAAVKNVSEKPIAAIKLSWHTLKPADATAIGTSPCGTVTGPVELILSGETARIDVGSLAPGESCAIVMPYAAAHMATGGRTVTVNQPIISLKDIEELTTEATLKSLKRDCTIIVAVSEIEYADGTKWKSGGLPWERQRGGANARN